MSKQDEPERHFVAEKQPVKHELDEKPDDPRSGMFGPNMAAVGFLSDILRWIDRRRAAKKRAKASSDRSE